MILHAGYVKVKADVKSTYLNAVLQQTGNCEFSGFTEVAEASSSGDPAVGAATSYEPSALSKKLTMP